MNTYVVWGGIGKVFPLLPLFYFVSKSYMCNYIVPAGTKAPPRMFINDWERGRGKRVQKVLSCFPHLAVIAGLVLKV